MEKGLISLSIEKRKAFKSGINRDFRRWKMEMPIIFQFQCVLVNEESDQDGEDDCYGKNW